MPTLTTVLMSTPLLIKVQYILQSNELFSQYMVALKLDNPSASHTQVMQSLQTFLASLPKNKRLQVEKVFAEEEASDSMGMAAKLSFRKSVKHYVMAVSNHIILSFDSRPFACQAEHGLAAAPC